MATIISSEGYDSIITIYTAHVFHMRELECQEKRKEKEDLVYSTCTNISLLLFLFFGKMIILSINKLPSMESRKCFWSRPNLLAASQVICPTSWSKTGVIIRRETDSSGTVCSITLNLFEKGNPSIKPCRKNHFLLYVSFNYGCRLSYH